jgi:hypothetical protein
MMEKQMKYYVTNAGAYIGGFETNPPASAIEVPYAPDHAGQIWDGSGWGAIPVAPREIHVAWFKAALADMGKLNAVDAAVATLPAAKQVMWEYATSINEADADVIAIASALKINLAAVFDKAETIRTDKLS